MFATCFSRHLHTRLASGFFCRLPDFSVFAFHTSFVAGFSCRPPDVHVLPPLKGSWHVFPVTSIQGSRLDFRVVLLNFIVYHHYDDSDIFSLSPPDTVCGRIILSKPQIFYILPIIPGSLQDFLGGFRNVFPAISIQGLRVDFLITH